MSACFELKGKLRFYISILCIISEVETLLKFTHIRLILKPLRKCLSTFLPSCHHPLFPLSFTFESTERTNSVHKWSLRPPGVLCVCVHVHIALGCLLELELLFHGEEVAGLVRRR